MARTCIRGGGLERIRLLAKLDVRRSGPGVARYAYRWQSAWEDPMEHLTIMWAPRVLRGARGILAATAMPEFVIEREIPVRER